MEGNIIYVNYELSSWRYFNTDEVYEPSKYFSYISGTVSKPENCDIIVKSYGYVLADNLKGMGSAYGGAIGSLHQTSRAMHVFLVNLERKK